MFRLHKRTVVLVIAALAALVGGAVSQASSSTVHLSRVASVASPRGPVSATLRRNFSVLRRSHVASASSTSELPSSVAATLTEPGSASAEYGVKPAEARYAPLANSAGAWVVPGTTGICLVEHDAQQSISTVLCGPTSDADSGKLLMTNHGDASSGPVTIWGLAPDASSSVTATSSDGSSTTIPVVDNVYEATVTQLRTVAVHGVGGVSTINLP